MIVAAMAALAVAAVAGWMWMGRSSSESAEARDNEGKEGKEITVPVARVQRGDVGETMKLAGAFKPFQDVLVHAKVAGYIRKIYVDVGDRVKEGKCWRCWKCRSWRRSLLERTRRAARRESRSGVRKETWGGRNRRMPRRIRRTRG